MEWATDEIEKLKKLYPIYTNDDISKILNRPIRSIISKSNRLGLKKDKSHISKMISKRNKLIGRDLNYDNVKKIALKYNSKSEFQKMDGSAYVTARTNGYLDKICKHMNCFSFSIPQIMLKILIENLITNNIKYNDRITINPHEIDIFLPDFNVAFEYDGKRWHNDNKSDKIKEIKLANKKIILFRFVENSRKYEDDIKSQFKYFINDINKLTNKSISNSDIDSVDLSTAYSQIISKDKIHNICLKYDDFTDFRKKEYRIYSYLLKSKELQSFTSHMNKRIRWDDYKAIIEIKKFKTLKDLIKNSYGCYLWIKKNKKESLLSNLLK